jgi:WYL domain
MGVICDAIAIRHLIQFYYVGDDAPGLRLVEPHMVAYSLAGNLVLSAWFLGGASESQEGRWWREYRLDAMSQIKIMDQTFAGPRQGYNPNGGPKLRNIRCRL